MLQAKGVVVESRQEVLEFMGERRYYNKLNIKRGYISVPKDVKEYRLGLHRPGQKKKIDKYLIGMIKNSIYFLPIENNPLIFQNIHLLYFQ